jgi:DNA-binding NarL/FixJ family response regulator
VKTPTTTTSKSTTTTRILIADDHEMIRAGLRGLLERERGCEVIGEAVDGRDAVELAQRLSPDVVVSDITMPRLSGIEATRQMRAHNDQLKVIILSVHFDTMMVAEALRAGACGYLLKSSAPAELTLALRAARDGETYLSPRVSQVVVSSYVRPVEPGSAASAYSTLTPKQREVLQLLAEGKSNKEVAAQLFISAKTVEAHRAQIMEKLNIFSLAGLTKYAVREGLTNLDD